MTISEEYREIFGNSDEELDGNNSDIIFKDFLTAKFKNYLEKAMKRKNLQPWIFSFYM